MASPKGRTRAKTGGNPRIRNWAKVEQMEGDARTAETGAKVSALAFMDAPDGAWWVVLA